MDKRIPPALLAWYDLHARDLPWRRSRDPYQIWVSEIMLQQTRVETVIPYFLRFVGAFPDIASLAGAGDELLLKLWEGLGYYSRARNLKKGARMVMEEFGGVLPGSAELLKGICGIGPYTAGAIASIGFGERAAAVDGNVLRIVSRLARKDWDIAQGRVKREVEALLTPLIPERSGDFNQALMDLGAMVCTSTAPACGSCPLKGFCLAAGEEACLYPRKKKKPPKKCEERTILAVCAPEGCLLHKRPAKGLLAGLFEPVNLPGRLSEEQALSYVSENLAKPLEIEPLPEAKHIFTHLCWQMSGYRIRAEGFFKELPAGFAPVRKEQMESACPLPSAFRAYLPYLFKEQGQAQGSL